MTAAASYPRLLGDVGGTNSRLAWQESAASGLADIVTYKNDDYASLLDVMLQHLKAHGYPAPANVSVGIANPVTGDQVKMTNRDWSFSISEMERSLGTRRLLVINDFTALALSLPALSPTDLMQVGGEQPVAGAAVALLGPGTGLGVSGLLMTGQGSSLPIPGEGGHATLAATDDLEADILSALRGRFGHVSAERALSGPGLVNLYDASCAVAGKAPTTRTAADITAAATDGSDPQCVQALNLFFCFLGNVAGNLALTLGARGGVYIGGGIVPRLGQRITSSGFRARFEGKGRFQSYLAPIPVYVIDAKTPPALVGASRALDHL